MRPDSPERQLAAFMAKYTPAIVARASQILEALRGRLPGTVELVYLNYNALVVGFGPNERASDAIFLGCPIPALGQPVFSPRAGLPDPQKVLKEKGKQVRHIVLEGAADLEKPAIRELMRAALERAEEPIDRKAPRRLVIKSISAKQRPRRPA